MRKAKRNSKQTKRKSKMMMTPINKLRNAAVIFLLLLLLLLLCLLLSLSLPLLLFPLYYRTNP